MALTAKEKKKKKTKHFFSLQEGLQSVLNESGTIDALVKAMEYVSLHMKLNIMQVFAVLCIVDINAHRYSYL